MDYSKLAELYQKLEATTKRLEKTYYISQLLKSVSLDNLQELVLLLQGRVFPQWDERKLGVASRLVLKAIHISTGISSSEIEGEWKKTGDLGLVAENLVAKKKQVTLFSQDLTVKKVLNNIRKLPEFEGTGTVDKKLKLISELLTSAKPLEARYIIRTVLEELRVGVGSGSLRDAIVWSFFPPINGIFFQCSSCSEFVPKSSKCLKCNAPLDTKFRAKSFEKGLNVSNIEEVQKIKDFSKFEAIFTDDEKLAREIYKYLVDAVQSAFDMSNDFSFVAYTSKKGNISGLLNVHIEPLKPLKVMLAQKVNSVEDAFERVKTPAGIEYKYDGFRMQIHKKANTIILFTRSLENVTKQFPEVVDYVKKNVTGTAFIIDSEAVGFSGKTGKYLPFQSISQRIKRKHNIDDMSKKFPVELNIFDILFYEGKNMIKTPFSDRRALLNKITTEKEKKLILAKNIVTEDKKEAERFYKQSLDAGNEGVIFKNLTAPYKPGSRVGYMVKLKPVMETLDLVIVGAEWGEGKRSAWMTSFNLACIDENGNFLDIGKVGTGIKELAGAGATFEQLTELIKPLVTSESGKKVKVKPRIVVEINYEEIQKSTNYASGYALRFPRLLSIRIDRSPEEISDIDLVENLFFGQKK